MPYVVVEGSRRAAETAAEDLRVDGWLINEGWRPPHSARRTVCVGPVESAEDAAAALLAAVAGAGLVIEARADREIIDRLCDDLRRFGPVDHRIGPADREEETMPDEERALLEILLAGASLGEAAHQLGLSRRTADRRLAAARRRLEVTSTAAALTAFARTRRSGAR